MRGCICRSVSAQVYLHIWLLGSTSLLKMCHIDAAKCACPPKPAWHDILSLRFSDVLICIWLIRKRIAKSLKNLSVFYLDELRCLASLTLFLLLHLLLSCISCSLASLASLALLLLLLSCFSRFSCFSCFSCSLLLLLLSLASLALSCFSRSLLILLLSLASLALSFSLLLLSLSHALSRDCCT